MPKAKIIIIVCAHLKLYEVAVMLYSYFENPLSEVDGRSARA